MKRLIERLYNWLYQTEYACSYDYGCEHWSTPAPGSDV